MRDRMIDWGVMAFMFLRCLPGHTWVRGRVFGVPYAMCSKCGHVKVIEEKGGRHG